MGTGRSTLTALWTFVAGRTIIPTGMHDVTKVPSSPAGERPSYPGMAPVRVPRGSLPRRRDAYQHGFEQRALSCMVVWNVQNVRQLAT
jgi:hypothetical protein